MLGCFPVLSDRVLHDGQVLGCVQGPVVQGLSLLGCVQGPVVQDLSLLGCVHGPVVQDLSLLGCVLGPVVQELSLSDAYFEHCCGMCSGVSGLLPDLV